MHVGVLIDAGPLVALIDRSDDWHLRCRRTFEGLDVPLFTVWPALAEASHLLRSSSLAQSWLLRLIEAESVKVALERCDLHGFGLNQPKEPGLRQRRTA